MATQEYLELRLVFRLPACLNDSPNLSAKQQKGPHEVVTNSAYEDQPSSGQTSFHVHVHTLVSL